MFTTPQVRKVAVLGASGSIGRSAAMEFAEHPETFNVTGLAARSSIDELIRQAQQFNPAVIALTDQSKLTELRSKAPKNCRCLSGEEALIEIATDPQVDIVLCAIVGTGGIPPVLAALRAGKTVALASKEVLVVAGDLVMKEGRGRIITVDSEHSGVFQCLAGRRDDEIAKICLTASGGPFRTWNRKDINCATLNAALAHPTWRMGQKITIDSASMMNKALEIVEAHHLFNLPSDKIDVLIHPQSIVHALVEFVDGSMVAQMSTPNMRLAIRYALTYPNRLSGSVPKLDLAQAAKLEFFAPDAEKFPSLTFAREALKRGGTMPAVMNAANEIAVERFVRGEIQFGDIWKIIEQTMARHHAAPQESFAQLRAVDWEARVHAREVKI